MKTFCPILLASAFIICGCATVTDPKNPDMKYRVSYADTNHDGYIDCSRYAWHGADGDYSFEDTDFDGRYDECTVYGVGVFRKSVDYPIYLDSEKKQLNRAFLSPP